MEATNPNPSPDMTALASAIVGALQQSGAIPKARSGGFQKDERKQDFKTVYENVVPNGATQLTLSVTMRRPIDPVSEEPIDKETSYFVTLEHFLKYSREGSKVLYKVTIPAKREVLEALGFSATEASKHLPQ